MVSRGIVSTVPGARLRGSVTLLARAISRHGAGSPYACSAMPLSVSVRCTTYVFSTSGDWFLCGDRGWSSIVAYSLSAIASRARTGVPSSANSV